MPRYNIRGILIFQKKNLSNTSGMIYNVWNRIIKRGGLHIFMKYVYKTKGTCSTLIELELEGNIVHNVKFTGGCNGNLQAIPKLVEGLTVEQVEQKIGGISCNGRGTSCGDQLAKACREAYEAEQK